VPARRERRRACEHHFEQARELRIQVGAAERRQLRRAARRLVLHYSAVRAGLSFLPMTLSVALASAFSPRLVARFGVRPVLAAGMLSAAAGLALLTGVGPGSSYLSSVLPGGVLGAAGLGFSLVPATIAAVQGVSAAQSGLASGLLNTSRLAGGAVGLAALSTIAASHSHGQLLGGASQLGALTSGYQLALGVGALICLAGALAAVVLLRVGSLAAAPEPAGPAPVAELGG
jgi:MFS family permease